MRRYVARLAIAAVCSLSVSAALASPGPQHPRRGSARPSESAGHHAARPAPDATPAPAMPGPTAAQVLSGPLPMFPLPPTSLFNSAPSTYTPRRGTPPFNRLQVSSDFGGFAIGAYGPSDSTPPSASAPAARAPGPREIGTLLLDVEPATARVYVDDVDQGVVSDFRRTGLMLLAGPHRIELRAAGYESLTIDVTIVADVPTRYRGNLPATRAPMAGPEPPRRPDTFYIIPGCYAGNRPPIAERLPSGCDIAKMRTEVIR